jgi:hypothetical protein
MNKSMVIIIALLAVIGMMVATPTINVYAKKDKVESMGPTQSPDPKRLISDDPAGSPGDVGGQHGYDTGRKGGSCDTKGHHTAEFSSSFNESCKMAKQDQELKKNGQLSQVTLMQWETNKFPIDDNSKAFYHLSCFSEIIVDIGNNNNYKIIGYC